MFALAPSSGIQSYAAYAIQELLRKVEFTNDVLFRQPRATQPSHSPQSLGNKRKTRGSKSQRSGTKAQDHAKIDKIRQRWELLPPHVVEIIMPLLDSKYTSQSSSRLPSAADLQHAQTLCIVRTSSQVSWLRSWVIELIGQLGDSPVASLFKACTSAIKEGSTDMLLFLLPQLIYQHCLLSLQDSTKPNSPEEVITVGSDDPASEDVDMESGSSATWPRTLGLISKEIQAVLSCDAEVVRMPAEQWRLCKEAALDLLDSLNRFLRTQQSARAASKRPTRKSIKDVPLPPDEQTLAALVASIPHSLIAAAASACRQYERAIQHTELSLREGTFGKYPTLFRNTDDSAVAAIQELYFNMGDADGVTGAAACRKQTDHKSAILKYEIEGDWSHALIGHESLLRSQPDNTEFQMAWIRCLQSMGQWEGAWAASHELYKMEPSGREDKQLNSACLAAAWRLGKWDWVEDKVTTRDQGSFKYDSAATFDTTLSALLARVYHQRSDLCKLALPLSLAVCAPDQGGSSHRPTALDLASRTLVNVGRDIAETVVSFNSPSTGTQAPMDTNISPDLIYTHMLGDIGLLAQRLNCAAPGENGISASALNSLVEQWRARIACLPPVYSIQEPVLALHSSLYNMLLDGLGSSGAEPDTHQAAAVSEILTRHNVLSHLQAAQLARMAGFRATAMGILIHAELSGPLSTSLLASLQTEHAQILWDEGHTADAMADIGRTVDMLADKLNVKGDSDQAVQSTYTAGVNVSSSDSADHNQQSQDLDGIKAAYTKASLLLSQWQYVTHSINPTKLISHYQSILRVQESDKAHYALGRMYDTLFTSITEREASRGVKNQDHRDFQITTMQFYVIRHYSRTIIYSSRFLFQALPRLLTIWLDAGVFVMRFADTRQSRVVERFNTANRVVSNMVKRLPTYNFLIALSAARLAHLPSETRMSLQVLEHIILSVLEMYPQQTLWQLVGVQRSTYAGAC
ncbi:hypothetical protein DL89DRAFT_136311 [Linderina pennispora]|uniref:non-specific serine/threonine protein kinase n=1 Tax=Linderina pennispora TaxID=61395 RepID=A0A1Y1WB90_9FUNG|nr:uncharacterized protein DL89DRAFT_136311 [Linderina pennispora]ORX70588.1 hypothetical protein DL89DRAFT_136311 [Linderina pennispora]